MKDSNYKARVPYSAPLNVFPVTVIEESIRWTDGLIGMIEKIGDDRLGGAIQPGVRGEALRLIREAMLGGDS